MEINVIGSKGFWRKLSKELGVARLRTLSLLVLNTILVIKDVKPAYLIDICVLSIEKAEYLAQQLLLLNRSSSKIKIVRVGDDVFIVNETILYNRMSEFLQISSSPSIHRQYSCAIIDLDLHSNENWISSDAVHICSKTNCDELKDMISILYDEFEMANANGCIIVDIQLNGTVYHRLGGPFIAGFLLGYPCIYKAVPCILTSQHADFEMQPLYQSASAKLSYKSLMKVTAFALIEVKDPFLSQGGEATVLKNGNIAMKIPVYEFSYPIEFTSPKFSQNSEILDSLALVVEEFRVAISSHDSIGCSSCSSSNSAATSCNWTFENYNWNSDGISL